MTMKRTQLQINECGDISQNSSSSMILKDEAVCEQSFEAQTPSSQSRPLQQLHTPETVGSGSPEIVTSTPRVKLSVKFNHCQERLPPLDIE